MIDRYNDRKIYKNSVDMYKKIFEDRSVKHINQYDTPYFKQLQTEEYDNISVLEHVWSTGDRFYKLAARHYGDPRDWWVIAKYNNKPTESHLLLGDILYIPFPLYEVISILKGR